MSGLSALSGMICRICIAVSILSVLIPRKRTAKILRFVFGMFLIAELVSGVVAQIESISVSLPSADEIAVQEYDESDYHELAAQLTADKITEALDLILKNEGITAEDIRVKLKISEDGRIYAERAVIYISEACSDRADEVKDIVYRNLEKEPEVYVAGQKAQ